MAQNYSIKKLLLGANVVNALYHFTSGIKHLTFDIM